MKEGRKLLFQRLPHSFYSVPRSLLQLQKIVSHLSFPSHPALSLRPRKNKISMKHNCAKIKIHHRKKDNLNTKGNKLIKEGIINNNMIDQVDLDDCKDN